MKLQDLESALNKDIKKHHDSNYGSLESIF